MTFIPLLYLFFIRCLKQVSLTKIPRPSAGSFFRSKLHHTCSVVPGLYEDLDGDFVFAGETMLFIFHYTCAMEQNFMRIFFLMESETK